MTQGNLKIHTENILPIIKKWLYSDRDVFVRELVSNAIDAMQKCRILRENKELDFQEEELGVDITVNSKEKTLTFSDTGIGMSAEEVEKYIAQIAFSGAEDFLETYKGKEETEAIIGHFGLGFYSAYMVAKKVTIDTLSYQPGKEPAFWSCDGGSTYTLEKGTRTHRGTTITLFLEEDSEEYLQEAKLKEILHRFCCFLPFPIRLNGKKINHFEPLWLKNPTLCQDTDYKKFFSFLYPLEGEPLFWVHLNIDYPFHLKGILFFPRIHAKFDWNKSHIKLFCNRVFVSDNCRDLLPDYLTHLLGAIDSPDIPLNVSRSSLQLDKTVKQIGSHIAKKIADKLHQLYQSSLSDYEALWEDVEIFVKLGSIQDEKFYEKVKDILLFKTTEGKYLTLSQLNPSSRDEKILYTSEMSLPSSLRKLYLDKNRPILILNRHIDIALMSHLEHKMDRLRFQRLDGGLDESILDNTKEDTLLDASGRTKGAQISSFFQSSLPYKDLTVEAKSLASDDLGGLIIVDEDMRRFQDYNRMTSKENGDTFPIKKTFVVNTSSELVKKIYALKEENEMLAKEMAQHLYELTQLSQSELPRNELHDFVERNCKILKELTKKL